MSITAVSKKCKSKFVIRAELVFTPHKPLARSKPDLAVLFPARLGSAYPPDSSATTAPRTVHSIRWRFASRSACSKFS